MSKVKGQESRVESQKSGIALRANADSRLLTLDSRRAAGRGLTLVELLITMMIISILAAAVLGVAAVAGQTAREAKTRNIVTRLHVLLAEQYGTYNSRRVRVRQQVLDGIDDATSYTVQEKQRLRVLARLYALRELMLLEMPQRWSEVLLQQEVPDPPTGTAAAAFSPIYLDAPRVTDPSYPQKIARVELSNIYLRNYRRIASATNKNHGGPNTTKDILSNQGAECLYMIIMNACGDGEARSLFRENTIGDTDGDGALEFIDGWGRPIEFVRWAPAFNSEIQHNLRQLGLRVMNNATWGHAAKTDHDPFDIQRVDAFAFRLIPLIISSGSDEVMGIRLRLTWSWRGIPNPDAPFTPMPALDPYEGEDEGGFEEFVYIGDTLTQPDQDEMRRAAADNVHNHFISTRAR